MKIILSIGLSLINRPWKRRVASSVPLPIFMAYLEAAKADKRRIAELTAPRPSCNLIGLFGIPIVDAFGCACVGRAPILLFHRFHRVA